MRSRIIQTVLGGVMSLGLLALAQSAGAQTFTPIYSFTGGADGGTPMATLLLNGTTLYGTTMGGGANSAGTVFTVDTSTHLENVLHSFSGGRADGAAPIAGVIRDAAGNLYGTTSGGGAHFFGTVYKIPAVGSYSLLHSFAGPPSEGSGPTGSLVMDHAGDIFGTTYTGGNSTGWGTVFEISAGGTYTTGKSFSPDGALPRSGLVLVNGSLYGTTYGGGAHAFAGTIYEVAVTTALFTFTGGPDGSQPMDNLISDGAGNLYGTASAGGDGSFGAGHGTIFKFNIAGGGITVLHTFTGPDGSTPAGSLVRDSAGNLYGTTMNGGANGHGTVFELDNLNNFQTLYSFTGGSDGSGPVAGLVLDGSGNLWGVAAHGGSSGYGTVFEINPNCGDCDRNAGKH